MAREYFLAYHSYLEIFGELSDAECGRLFRIALKYSATGKTLELRGNERFLFPTIKNQIDRDNKKYKEKCESNRENGKYGVWGGRPKKSKTHKNPDGFLETLREGECKGKCKSKGNKKEINKEKFGEFKNVMLTNTEFDKLKSRFPDYEARIERLSNYIESKGKRYKSHYATILSWAEKDNQNQTGGQNFGSNQKHTARKVCTEYPE